MLYFLLNYIHFSYFWSWRYSTCFQFRSPKIQESRGESDLFVPQRNPMVILLYVSECLLLLKWKPEWIWIWNIFKIVISYTCCCDLFKFIFTTLLNIMYIWHSYMCLADYNQGKISVIVHVYFYSWLYDDSHTGVVFIT